MTWFLSCPSANSVMGRTFSLSLSLCGYIPSVCGSWMQTFSWQTTVLLFSCCCSIWQIVPGEDAKLRLCHLLTTHPSVPRSGTLPCSPNEIANFATTFWSVSWSSVCMYVDGKWRLGRTIPYWDCLPESTLYNVWCWTFLPPWHTGVQYQTSRMYRSVAKTFR